VLIIHEAEEACRGPAPAHEIDGEGELGVRSERVPHVPVHHSSEAEWNVDERLAQLGELAQGRGQVFAERLRLAGAPRDGARSKKSYLYLCRRYDITRACPPSAGDRPATNVTI
jgi:hypothetical protein